MFMIVALQKNYTIWILDEVNQVVRTGMIQMDVHNAVFCE